MRYVHRPASLSADAPAAKAARQLTWQTVQRAKRARRHLIVSVPLTALVVLAYRHREELFGLDLPIRLAAAVLLLVLGWSLARDVGRSLQPWLFGRMDPATAGTVGFLIRLAFLVGAALFSLRLLGLKPETLAVGGAITAVIFGLAAQQTLGHLIAGMVLISARPFRVGDRVRLHAGGLAGQVEGRVASLGLLYTTLAQGEDSILVPNSVVLSAAAVPLREPAGVDLRARLRPDVKPSQVQQVLRATIRTPVRAEPHIGLEEIDAEEVVVRITATPEYEADGPQLADEILAAIAGVTEVPPGTGAGASAAGGVSPAGDGAGRGASLAGDGAGRGASPASGRASPAGDGAGRGASPAGDGAGRGTSLAGDGAGRGASVAGDGAGRRAPLAADGASRGAPSAAAGPGASASEVAPPDARMGGVMAPDEVRPADSR